MAAPLTPRPVQAQIIAMHARNTSKAQIARELGIDAGTVTRVLEHYNVTGIERESAESVGNILDRVGATKEVIAGKLTELLSATEIKRATFEGKFTDERTDRDNTTQFRAAEALGKMHGMFPREGDSLTAQLFVRLPDVELRPGHGRNCSCPECCDEWSRTVPAITVESTDGPGTSST